MSIEEMLPLYCDGMLSEEDCRRVESWIEEDEEHRRILNDILNLYMDMDALDIMSEVDTEKALKRTTAKIRSRSLKRWAAKMQKFAAMLAIPLAAAVAYMAFDGRTQTEEQEPVRMMEFRTNAGMTGKLMLPDGSTAILNSESVLKYPSNFSDDSLRCITFEGEAFFDIVKDESHPFVIKTASEGNIKVYGTRFNLEAYPGENVITTLVEGRVGFIYDDKRGDGHEVMLTPNHKLEFNPVCRVLAVKETSCLAETAWKDGKILLDKTPMNDILDILSKRYDVEFVVSDPAIENMTFSGGMVTMNRLEHLLESLSISSSFRWRYLDTEDLSRKRRIELYY